MNCEIESEINEHDVQELGDQGASANDWAAVVSSAVGG